MTRAFGLDPADSPGANGPSRRIRRARGLRLWRWALALLAALCFAHPSHAQAPKAFDTYEDAANLGFRIKFPKDWKFIPPQPGDKNLIGKFDPKNESAMIQIQNGPGWGYHMWLVKFDRRKKPEAAGDKKDGPRIEFPGLKDVEAFVKGETEIPGNWVKNPKEGGALTIEGVDASWCVYDLTKNGTPLRVYVALYKLSPDLEIAVVLNGPGDDKKWSKFEGPFQTIGKSFRRIELETGTVADAKAGDSPLRARKRAELTAVVNSQPGWALHETPNYFILSNNTDVEFMKELKVRLEAIRKSYEETYPPAMVLELKRLRDEAQAKKKAADAAAGKPPAESEGDEPEDPNAGRSTTQPVDPMEMSRCSVVRVVQNRDQYHSYGGPGGSAGYWSSFHQELVIYDDQASGGRRNTWATMNHEAFHQYIYYFFGNLAPHSWYNEGNGDFYAGYQLKNGRFELKPFDWRISTIKEALRMREGGKQTFVPLKELVRYTQAEYYGNNKYGIDGGDNYAQGWSLIWFMRTGPKNARGWNKAWTPILDNYLRVLVETDDLDAAVDQAFAGVDWEEFEKAWIDYTLAI